MIVVVGCGFLVGFVLFVLNYISGKTIVSF